MKWIHLYETRKVLKTIKCPDCRKPLEVRCDDLVCIKCGSFVECELIKTLQEIARSNERAKVKQEIKEFLQNTFLINRHLMEDW